ncbi:MAG: hypothetical protein ABJR46_01195 [Tateyamaria sp.]|uniref:hypothetical protein n=1 Tax=Tateyamaria sp. TaxID=1929288 RepID=UPI00326B6DBD
MEYSHREELKSEPAGEGTTMMMRSVREILQTQGQEHLLDPENFESSSEAATMPPRSMPSAATSDFSGLQQPPHMQNMQAVINPALSQAATSPTPSVELTQETSPAVKSRSLLSRLIGR